jgi:hypothetical protein
MQSRPGSKSSFEPQKKTDGKVSVVSVKNSKDSPFHNPNHPANAVGVAYKGRMESKTIAHEHRVAYSHEDIQNHYGSDHHLTPMLSKLLDHAHKIHGSAPIIQHDIHTTTPEKDLHHSYGKVTWQPNVVRNSTIDKKEIGKLKKAKIVIASHTAFDKNFHNPHGLVPGKDVKEHPDVYNVDLHAPKISHKVLEKHNKAIGSHVGDSLTRKHLDVVSKGLYHQHLEPYVNHMIKSGHYGDTGHSALSHEGFKQFVSDAHDKEIAKVKTDKAKSAKLQSKHQVLHDVDKDKESINKTFKVHHAFTNAVRDYVHETHKADERSSIKHEVPSDHGFKPAPPEGYVPRGKHAAASTTKLNPRHEFNRINAIHNTNLRAKKPVAEMNESEEKNSHAVIIPGARMQPFHRGHEQLINDALAKNKGPVHLYITKNKPGDTKNPLSFEHRADLIKHAFKKHIESGHLHVHEGGSMFDNISHFNKSNPHVKHAHIVLGPDREGPIESIHKYNNTPDKKGNIPYKFHSISTSIRKETSNEHDNIHATELRNKAYSNASPEEKLHLFKQRMHPDIPEHLIKKTISSIEKTRPNNIKEFFSFSKFCSLFLD